VHQRRLKNLARRLKPIYSDDALAGINAWTEQACFPRKRRNRLERLNYLHGRQAEYLSLAGYAP
jgi:hypothetical protein